MPKSRVYLGASFEQHWRFAAAPWFAQACRNSWKSALPMIVLVPSRAHGYFLRSRLLNADLNFAGIHFWTPVDARAFLSARFPASLATGTRENLHLLLAAAAEAQDAQPSAASVALEPDSLLHVIDKIEAAGWNVGETSLPGLDEVVEEFHQLLTGAGLQTLHQTDERLLQSTVQSTPVIGSLLLYGFNSTHWPLWTILRATCRAASDATICLDQLRLNFAEFDAAWIGSWEENFGAGEQLPADDAAPHLAEYAEAVELGNIAKTRGTVSFLVGADTVGQAKAIVAQTFLWLADDRCERLGIVFPGYGALSREVAALLNAAGVPHNDSIGHLRPGPFETELWQAWLALQESTGVSTFARFVRACPHRLIAPLHADEIEEALRNAFDQILINDLAVLAAYLDRDGNSERKRAIAAWVRSITRLPDRATLSQFNETADRIFKAFGWTAQAQEIARQSAQLKKFGSQISRRAYLRWLSEIIDSFQRVRDDNGSHPYAKVHLTSYDHAHGQHWSHLILTSLNEGVWPVRPVESGYLSERQIDELNARIIAHNKGVTRQGSQGEGHITVREGKAFCIGPRQQRSLARRQFLDLIEGTGAALCATVGLSDESDPARRLKPGDFFNRLFHADRGQPVSDQQMNSLNEQTRDWISGARIFQAEPTDGNTTGQMLRAFRARRDITQPFGEFEFALKRPPHQPVTIPCTDWDRVVRAPAAIWMKNFAGIEPPIYEEGTEPWMRTIGTWVHDWLERISPGRSDNTFSAFPAAAEFLAGVRNAADATRAEVERLVADVGRTLPPWWFSVWSQAAFFSGKLARLIGALGGWPEVASEFRLIPPVPVQVNGDGILRVDGRIDLLLASGVPNDGTFRGRTVWIIDYKTGSKAVMKASELEKGNGFQLALYALALRQLGADEVQMSVVKPQEPAEPQLTLRDLAGFERVWDELCRMQETGIFGARGEMRSEFGAGAIYPLATLEIDADVLAEKWERTHRGFVREEEDDAE
ncbi:MAG: PD-(D/E)XK nuclease family protein [Verrucomicrobia bacterium]|nr:PD-(D/E)XK nuclease family protein [Verrucomicrobiota bacterium]